MNSSLIFDIKKTVDLFDIHKVKIFISKNCYIYSITSAVALKSFLEDELGLESSIVLTNSSREQIPENINDLLCDIEYENPEDIERNGNDFISIVLDANSLSDIENLSYNNTFIVFEVSGETDVKAFGAKAFNTKDALCSAEIIYSGIMKYCNTMHRIHMKSLGMLYTSLLDITSNFHSHMKPDTFQILQELSENIIDTDYYSYIYSKKDIQDLRLLQAVYTDTKIDDNIAYTIFPKETELYKIKEEKFKNCLEYLRYIDSIDIWLIFIEQENGSYNVLVQGGTLSDCDVSKIAVKNNGTGTRKRGKFTLDHGDIKMIIKDAKTICRNAKRPIQELIFNS